MTREMRVHKTIPFGTLYGVDNLTVHNETVPGSWGACEGRQQ